MGLKGGSNNRSTWGRDDIIDIMFVYETQKLTRPQCTIADAKPPNQMSRCFCSARVADI